MNRKASYLSRLLAVWILLAGHAIGQVPAATITGPIPADKAGSATLNTIYSASAMDLVSAGYIEEEYFIEGRANRYSSPELENAAIVDSDHRYKTRLIVRRPAASAFNGIVIVEWINVTGGPDKDIDWWQSGSHFMRNGYAYVVVSAQQMGIDTMRQWSEARYGSLDVTHDGMATQDELSYDIFSAVGRAINRVGESTADSDVDILAGLKAEQIIATGHSQSASRLATYLNNVHPLEPIYDGVMVHGGGGRIRDDQPVKIFKIMAETDMIRRAASPQPDTDTFRQWEVAGSSHVDVPFEIEYGKVRNLREGLSIENVQPRDQDCALPPYSRVPFRDVMDAAFEHLVVWIRDDVAPPTAEPLQLRRMMPEVEFARDEYGNVLGGIRLAEHVVATAKNTGMNSGSNRFCFLYGSHQPFEKQVLERLYPSHQAYVDAVSAVAQQNVAAGYILPLAAQQTIRNAQHSDIGR